MCAAITKRIPAEDEVQRAKVRFSELESSRIWLMTVGQGAAGVACTSGPAEDEDDCEMDLLALCVCPVCGRWIIPLPFGCITILRAPVSAEDEGFVRVSRSASRSDRLRPG